MLVCSVRVTGTCLETRLRPAIVARPQRFAAEVVWWTLGSYAGQMRYGWLVVLVCGCVGEKGERGSAGADGARGPQGEPGAAGERGAVGAGAALGLRWVDARGTLVGDQLTYVDDAGVLWPVDTETARVRIVDLQLLTSRFYTSSDCSGVAYVIPPLPRQPFISDAPTVRVRRDDTLPSDVQIGSAVSAGGSTCNTASGSRAVISFADMDVVQLPALSFVPPLHRELR